MKRLLAMLEPLSRRERGRGEGSHTRDLSSLRVTEPSPGATCHHGDPRHGWRIYPKGEGKNRLQHIRHALAVALVAFALALSAAAFAIQPLPFKNDAQRIRFQHLTRELRCMVCQDESLLASNADFAKQLRGQIFDMMQEGKSDQQIKDWLVARYSTFILYAPPLAPSTIALWFGTPAIFIAGGIVVIVLLRRRTRPAATIAEESGDDW